MFMMFDQQNELPKIRKARQVKDCEYAHRNE